MSNSVIYTNSATFHIDRERRKFTVHFSPGTWRGSFRPACGEPHEQGLGYTLEDERRYRDLSAEVGFQDLFEMALSHDLAHQLAAEAMGWPTAYSLFLQALGLRCRKCGTNVQRLVGMSLLDWEDSIAFQIQSRSNGLTYKWTPGLIDMQQIDQLAQKLMAILEDLRHGSDEARGTRPGPEARSVEDAASRDQESSVI